MNTEASLQFQIEHREEKRRGSSKLSESTLKFLA